MDWWKQRRRIRRTRGYIRTAEKPDAGSPFLVDGGRDRAFWAAATAIAAFERKVEGMRHPWMRLGDIQLREGYQFLPSKIPLCPDPHHPKTKAPHRFRSLGVKVNKSFFYEYWFMVRVTLDESGFFWRIDYAPRAKKRGRITRWLLGGLCWGIVAIFAIRFFTTINADTTDLILNMGVPMVFGFFGIMLSYLGQLELDGETEHLTHLKTVWLAALDEVEQGLESGALSHSQPAAPAPSAAPPPVAPSVPRSGVASVPSTPPTSLPSSSSPSISPPPGNAARRPLSRD